MEKVTIIRRHIKNMRRYLAPIHRLHRHNITIKCINISMEIVTVKVGILGAKKINKFIILVNYIVRM